ncbi:MAG TPA: SGNH/GDSL hydrolase family protein [Methyloceanibacter sp.]|nr:SGNH/GDSL hydrolase family protein [Methyloceanibacter sp.]
MFDKSSTRRNFLRGAIAGAAALSLPARSRSAEARPKHIVLLGDSILDNGAYVGKGPDVIEQLGKRLPPGSRATLGAIDGSLTSGVGLQLKIAPEDATHYVVSAGGNDALHYSSLINEKASSVADALERLAPVRESFALDYRAMLDDVTAKGRPVAVCTIYDAHFPDPKQRRVSSLGLTIFNDCITREAAARGLALIDLRLIITAPEDLANPIEPSVNGGAKIADAILAFASDDDAGYGRCKVFAGSLAKS